MSFFAHAVSSPGTPLSSFFPHLSCLPKAPVLGLIHVSLLSLPSSAHMPDAYIALFKLQSASETFPPQPSVWIFQGVVLWLSKYCTAVCEPPGVPWQTPPHSVASDHRHISSHSSVRRRLRSGVCRSGPSPGSEKYLFQVSLSPSFWSCQQLAFLGLWTQHPGLCLHLYEVFSACVSVHPLLFFKDTSHWIPPPPPRPMQ